MGSSSYRKSGPHDVLLFRVVILNFAKIVVETKRKLEKHKGSIDETSRT